MLRKPVIARLVWITAVVLALGLAGATLPTLLREASAIAAPTERTFSQLSPAEAQVLRQWGVSVDAYAVFVAAWTLSPLLIYLAVAAILFQRSPDQGVASRFSLVLVVIGSAMPYLGGITDFGAPWQPAVNLARALGLSVLLGLFYIFPNSKLVPGWVRPLAWLWALWMVYWLVAPNSPWVLLDATGALTPIGVVAALLGWGAGIYAQVYRYRLVSNSLERQQGKVFAFGFGAAFLAYVVAVAPYFLFPSVREPGWPYLLYGLGWVPLFTRLAFALIPLVIGFAVLRYRLWDIDLIIRRTLIYSVLTSLLAVIYFSTIIVLQPLFALVTGQLQSPPLTVLSTLAVAALFNPLRGTIQHIIDRRFYRRKYDAGRALATFNASVTDEVDAQQLTQKLVSVIGDTLQPAHVSLWLRNSSAASHPSTPPQPAPGASTER
jgi:hypothetical protein